VTVRSRTTREPRSSTRPRKLVVGAQPLAEEWANTIALGAYDSAAIRRLKRERDGVIYISGSGQLVRALLSEGLVDDLHLFVYPVAIGTGVRFWSEGIGPTRLVLKAQDARDNGVLPQAYGPA
jgi:dihydrofolate reductase